jgi:PAS domain S-box-containing protein
MKSDHKAAARIRTPETAPFDASAFALPLFETVSEAVFVRSLQDGRVLHCNAAAERLYGWSCEELCGSSLHETLHSVFPGTLAEAEHVLIAEGLWQGRLRQRTRHGLEVIVDCRAMLSRACEAVLEVHRDLTLALKAEAALRESEKLAAMGRVAAMIVHEINNPLAALANLVYLLELNPSLDSEARAYVRAASEELERVAGITRQTLGFYRETRETATVRVPDLLEDVLALEKSALRPAGIHLVKNYIAAGCVRVIPAELRQVFLNLVTNSIQAMPHGGTLRLSVRERAGQTVVSIVDTGSGIRADDRARLFEPFFSTKAAQGTGLGLWISKGIVEKFGGRIACRCLRMAGGSVTCFRVVLPCAPAADSVPDSSSVLCASTVGHAAQSAVLSGSPDLSHG